MKKYVWENYNGQSEIEDGKDVTFSEMQIIYKSLQDEYKSIADKIVESIDQNDYVKLSKLIGQRKHVMSAIDEMEALYGDKLAKSRKAQNRFATGLTKSARFADEHGEDALLNIFTSLERFNDTVRTVADKAVNISANAISMGNQMNYKVSRNLLSQTTDALLKLANTFKKRF